MILSLLVILTISCVSAAENTTDDVDLISITEQEADNISSSGEDQAVEAINETNDGEVLESTNSTETLTAPLTNDVLNTTVTVTPLGSSYKEPTKKQRTFKIGGFKIVLSPYKYKKLYQISGIEDEFFDYGYNEYYYVGEKFRGYSITSTGLIQTFQVKTNKFVKVKLTRGNKVYYKKSRVYAIFSYGQGQYGVPYRYIMILTHHYATYDRSYDDAGKVLGSNGKYFNKCKQSSSFTKLNKSKLYSQSYVYSKYSIY